MHNNLFIKILSKNNLDQKHSIGYQVNKERLNIMNNLKSSFTIKDDNYYFIYLEDHYPYKKQGIPIAEDIDNIIKFLSDNHLGNRRVFFSDLDGSIVEAIHDRHNRFLGFKKTADNYYIFSGMMQKTLDVFKKFNCTWN